MTKNYIKQGLQLLLIALLFLVAFCMIIYFALNLSDKARIQKNNNPYWQSDTPSYYKQITKSSVLHK